MSIIRLGKGSGAGGVGGSYGRPHRRVFAVAPSRSAQSVPYNTLRPSLVTVACFRLDDARFDFDSSFVLPAARHDLVLLAALRDQLRRCPMSIFGHADPTGMVDYNKALSGRRAKALYAVLVRDVEQWVSLWDHPLGGDKWSEHHLRLMLGALPCKATATPYLEAAPGPGSTLVNAVWLFQEENGLGVDGDPGPETRKALFRAYMDWLCDGERLHAAPSDFLGGGTDDGKCAYQGCSELNPVLVFSREEHTRLLQPERAHERNARHLPNRRVLVFFFRAGTEVSGATWPCPTVDEAATACRAQAWSDATRRLEPTDDERRYEDTKDTFSCRFYDTLALRSVCEGTAPVRAFRLVLRDAAHNPLPRARVHVEHDDQQWNVIADDNGGVLIVFDAEKPSTLRVWWAPADVEGDAVYAYGRHLYVDVSDDDAGDERRLYNLGYIKDELDCNVRDFEHDYGLALTGALSNIRTKLREVHDVAAGAQAAP